MLKTKYTTCRWPPSINHNVESPAVRLDYQVVPNKHNLVHSKMFNTFQPVVWWSLNLTQNQIST